MRFETIDGSETSKLKMKNKDAILSHDERPCTVLSNVSWG